MGTFVVTALGLTFVFAVAGAPIPMMQIYREQGVTIADFAHVSIGYFIAAAVGLACFGRASAVLGRRPVSMAAVLIGAASCVALIKVDGARELIIGRTLQGLACGLAPGSLGAWVVDAGGPGRRIPAALTGTAPMIGLPLGALVAAGLVEFASWQPEQVFAFQALLLGAVGILLAFGKETIAVQRPFIKARSSQGRSGQRIPRRAVAIAAGVLVATWFLGGFFQAYGSIVAVDLLGTSSALIAALAFASVMLLNPLGAAIGGLLPPRVAVPVGLTVFLFAMVATVEALRVASVAGLIACGLLCGCAQGVASTGSMRLLLPRLPKANRSEALTVIYFAAYLSVAVYAAIGAVVGSHVNLTTLAMTYAAVGSVPLLAVVALACLPSTSRALTADAGHPAAQAGTVS
ncbi:MFS family permease [Mycolicibacterium sp. BK556]|uniref:MFS transporter n=1 Tax=unclassified Mycolicibacterium TaxID=2636767 RepID=UPI001615E825|nr:MULTISPECIES: MFS transporter [unclassified Mycolicibacterium]MBB3607062.1 MFS family permease [Mycolicibacterium sp. BK556]MBB3636828.1 MFS family permease [Mycolicibacterium sp. BK607]